MRTFELHFFALLTLFHVGLVIGQTVPKETMIASLQSDVPSNRRHISSSNRNNDYSKVTLESGALFGHNKSGLEQLSEQGYSELYHLAIQIKRIGGVQSIVISGHSDVTNGTGIPNYNEKLSLQRAIAVRSYLAELGFDTSQMQVTGMGGLQPIKQDCPVPKGVIQTPIGVVKGSATREDMDAFRLCLQPNRRVEVEMIGQKVARLTSKEVLEKAEKVIWLDR